DPASDGELLHGRYSMRAPVYTAVQTFGPTLPSKPSMESFVRDLRQSLRMFAASPAFTLAAIAALTLGIGANTAIFSVVNAILLKPVAIPDSERVVVFMNVSPNGAGPAASPAKFNHYRAQTEVAQDISAFTTGVMN